MNSGSTPHDRHTEFVQCLNASHRRLLAYLISLLGNRHDAEDVLQRASLTMWNRFATFESGTNFTAWACTVAFYEAKNFRRAAARSRLQFSDELIEILADERLEDLSHSNDRWDALEHCLQKLDKPGRLLVEAAYYEESDIATLAASLGRAPQTLYNKLNFIRRSLAECVTRRLSREAGT